MSNDLEERYGYLLERIGGYEKQLIMLLDKATSLLQDIALSLHRIDDEMKNVAINTRELSEIIDALKADEALGDELNEEAEEIAREYAQEAEKEAKKDD